MLRKEKWKKYAFIQGCLPVNIVPKQPLRRFQKMRRKARDAHIARKFQYQLTDNEES